MHSKFSRSKHLLQTSLGKQPFPRLLWTDWPTEGSQAQFHIQTGKYKIAKMKILDLCSRKHLESLSPQTASCFLLLSLQWIHILQCLEYSADSKETLKEIWSHRSEPMKFQSWTLWIEQVVGDGENIQTSRKFQACRHLLTVQWRASSWWSWRKVEKILFLQWKQTWQEKEATTLLCWHCLYRRSSAARMML